jgi:hypothetical protein
VLNAISVPVAWVVVWVLISMVERAVGGTIQVAGRTRITEDYLLSYIFYPLIALATGLFQYLWLRRYLPRMGWWLAATALGLLVGLFGSSLLSRILYGILDLQSAWFAILVTGFVGAFLGLAQWLMLRQRVHRAGWWIVANALGWSIVGWGAATLSNQMMLPALGSILVPGIATAVALWLLLDQWPQREGGGGNLPPSKPLEPTSW